MSLIIDNTRLSVEMESAITERELKSEAIDGRYYSYKEHKWESMGWIETILRNVFFLFVDSVVTTCLSYSWKAIEEMPTCPTEIKKHIKDRFLDSLHPTNPRYNSAAAISRLFCKLHVEKEKDDNQDVNQIDIQKHSKDRSFGIFVNKELAYLAANSRWGHLDFFTPKEVKKVISNSYDSLWDTEGKRTGAIRLRVDNWRMDAAMELSDGQDSPLAKVIDVRNKTVLVFREVVTNQVLAVANRVKGNWRVTIINQAELDKKQITPLLIAWTVLKYEQHYFFPNPKDLHYKELPKEQVFVEQARGE